jgi:hypothetical protein
MFFAVCLPPPMAGFFEFSMMRTREDIDRKLPGKLFYRYFNTCPFAPPWCGGNSWMLNK